MQSYDLVRYLSAITSYAPIRSFMPNGYSIENIDDFLSEFQFTLDVFDCINAEMFVLPRKLPLLHTAYTIQYFGHRLEINTDMGLRYIYDQESGAKIVRIYFESFGNTQTHQRTDEYNGMRYRHEPVELENALQPYSLQLTEAFARNF